MMPPKGDVVRAVRTERRRTLALVTGLKAEEFDIAVLPRWRVREVLAHLITTDRASVTGAILPVVLGSMEKLEAWNDRQVGRWANRPPADLIVGLDRWGHRFAGMASRLPARLYQLPVPTLWGRGPAGMLVFGRAYDEWVHRQDLRRALGRADDEVDVSAAGEFLLRAIGQHTVPMLRGEGGRIEVSLEGAPLPMWAYDLATGDSGPAGGAASPDARVEAPAAAFIMAAAGRGTFAELESVGSLGIEGDAGLARRMLSRIRIV